MTKYLTYQRKWVTIAHKGMENTVCLMKKWSKKTWSRLERVKGEIEMADVKVTAAAKPVAKAVAAAKPVEAAKAETKASRKGRFEAMNKELKDPKIFATLNDEQEKKLNENLEILKEVKVPVIRAEVANSAFSA